MKSMSGDRPAKTVTIGPAEDGLEIGLELSDRLVIRLPENPTTGVRWHWDQRPGPVQLERDVYDTPGGAAVGAASVRVLEFRAAAQGHVVLQLRLGREWEPDAAAEQVFAVRIHVD